MVDVDPQRARSGPHVPGDSGPEPAAEPRSTLSAEATTSNAQNLENYYRNSNNPSSSNEPTSTVDEESSYEGQSNRPYFSRLKEALRLPWSTQRDSEIIKDYQVQQLIRSLNEYPVGYGKLAAIQDCDPNLMIYRKFGWLHARVLLHYQDELAELEDELELLDEFHFRNAPDRLTSRRKDDTMRGARRKEIVQKINEKLADYGELPIAAYLVYQRLLTDHEDLLVLRVQQIQAIRRPTKRNQTNLFNAISNTGSVSTQELKWVQQGADLAAIAHDNEQGWFNGFLEDCMNKISRTMTVAIFRSDEQKQRTGDEYETMRLVSVERLDVFMRIMITIIAAVLLLVPVIVLFELQPKTPSEIKHKSRSQILVIFLFTLVFSASCSVLTKARKHEVFAATAAYCAVLVIFLGNTSNVMITNGA